MKGNTTVTKKEEDHHPIIEVLLTQPTSPQLPILQSSWTESSSPPILDDDDCEKEDVTKVWQRFDIHRWNELLHHHRSTPSSRWGRSFRTGTVTRHGERMSSLPPLARAQSTIAASVEVKTNGNCVSSWKSIKQGLDPISLQALATLAERHSRSKPMQEQRHHHFQPLLPLLETSSSSNDATASTITEDEEEESTPLLSYVQLHRTFPENHPHEQNKDADDVETSTIKSRLSSPDHRHSSTPKKSHVVYRYCRFMCFIWMISLLDTRYPLKRIRLLSKHHHHVASYKLTAVHHDWTRLHHQFIVVTNHVYDFVKQLQPDHHMILLQQQPQLQSIIDLLSKHHRHASYKLIAIRHDWTRLVRHRFSIVTDNDVYDFVKRRRLLLLHRYFQMILPLQQPQPQPWSILHQIVSSRYTLLFRDHATTIVTKWKWYWNEFRMEDGTYNIMLRLSNSILRAIRILQNPNHHFPDKNDRDCVKEEKEEEEDIFFGVGFECHDMTQWFHCPDENMISATSMAKKGTIEATAMIMVVPTQYAMFDKRSKPKQCFRKPTQLIGRVALLRLGITRWILQQWNNNNTKHTRKWIMIESLSMQSNTVPIVIHKNHQTKQQKTAVRFPTTIPFLPFTSICSLRFVNDTAILQQQRQMNDVCNLDDWKQNAMEEVSMRTSRHESLEQQQRQQIVPKDKEKVDPVFLEIPLMDTIGNLFQQFCAKRQHRKLQRQRQRQEKWQRQNKK